MTEVLAKHFIRNVDSYLCVYVCIEQILISPKNNQKQQTKQKSRKYIVLANSDFVLFSF